MFIIELINRHEGVRWGGGTVSHALSFHVEESSKAWFQGSPFPPSSMPKKSSFISYYFGEKFMCSVQAPRPSFCSPADKRVPSGPLS